MATKAKSPKKTTRPAALKNGVPVMEPGEVLTLAEAAAYLRVSEEDLVQSATSQGLPGRQIGGEWRFLKSSLHDWLNEPAKKSSQQVLLEMAGKFKDDPFLEEITREAYRKRGRPITEDGE